MSSKVSSGTDGGGRVAGGSSASLRGWFAGLEAPPYPKWQRYQSHLLDIEIELCQMDGWIYGISHRCDPFWRIELFRIEADKPLGLYEEWHNLGVYTVDDLTRLKTELPSVVMEKLL